MKPKTLQVLRELRRRHEAAAAHAGKNTIDARPSDLAETLDLPEEEIEDALESLIEQEAVERHVLGQFELTEIGVRKSGGS